MKPWQPAAAGRQWYVCGLLLLALVLNYMDRQTLSLTITAIEREIALTNQQYGRLEKGFGYAFAAGGLAFGLLADRLSIRWLYPAVLLGWSAAGIATGYADRLGATIVPVLARWLGDATLQRVALTSDADVAQAYLGFLACRVALGFFEAGQWPCALVVTQRLLSKADRSLGNSILQSGASIGAILTPFIVGAFSSGGAGWWRMPYVVIGSLGIAWIVPWFWSVRGIDLRRPTGSAMPPAGATFGVRDDGQRLSRPLFARRFLALVVVVVVINLTWQFFRVWLPKMLEQYHGYTPQQVRWMVVAYYLSTDLGCISAGYTVKRLAGRGMDVHRARIVTFGVCALLASSSVIAAQLPKGPLLLTLLLITGFGTLGLFPNYYAFTQELTTRYQGALTGVLGFTTWVITSEVQELVGKSVDQTGSYRAGITWIGLAPLAGLAVMLILWRPAARNANSQHLSVF
jgi:ACS family hexuronate transporter-like MFS transporter